MKADQERVAKLLNDTVTLLCKNGLIYRNQLTVQGLLGITLDKNEVFIVHINESIGTSNAGTDSALTNKQKQTTPSSSNIVDLTTVADPPTTTFSAQQNLRYTFPVAPAAPLSTTPRKHRPQTLNPAMLFQRTELLQQMQHRLRMNNIIPQGLNSSAMPMIPIPSGLSVRQPARPFLPRRHVSQTKRPILPQQNQTPISLVDEDDVVIIGTGREEPYCNQKRGTPNRVRRSPQSQRGSHLPSNEPHSIVIPQETNLFPDQLNQGLMESVGTRIQSLSSLHSNFGEPKNFLGEIIIEPNGAADLDISNIVDQQGGLETMKGVSGMTEIDDRHTMFPIGGKKSLEANQDDEIMVYLDMAEDDKIRDVKPSCAGIGEGVQNVTLEMQKESIEPMDEEVLNFESVGLHMLTEDDDDLQPSLVPWQCKVQGCRGNFLDPSLLASHYVVEHTEQFDLSAKEAKYVTLLTRQQLQECNEKNSHSSCPEMSCSESFDADINLETHDVQPRCSDQTNPMESISDNNIERGLRSGMSSPSHSDKIDDLGDLNSDNLQAKNSSQLDSPPPVVESCWTKENLDVNEENSNVNSHPTDISITESSDLIASANKQIDSTDISMKYFTDDISNHSSFDYGVPCEVENLERVESSSENVVDGSASSPPVDVKQESKQ